jgi:hypothetical protein
MLRIAATAFMYGRCAAEARTRSLAPPMPVLQGWTPAEYVQCADWLPILAWPALVGLGSVCRRALHGPDGILAILEAVDRILPPHTKLHLFGVKSSALDYLAHHPRVASVDSMAWDVSARAERRTGRDMAFRIGHMHAWADRQNAIANRVRQMGAQSLLFDPADFGGISNNEALILDALATQYADLILSGDLDYRDAVHRCHYDGVTAIAMVRASDLDNELIAAFNDLMCGFGDTVEQLIAGRQP